MNAGVTPLAADVCDIAPGRKPLAAVTDTSRTYLPTPYRRTIPAEHSDAAVWASAYNYTPYDKWCLRCNLNNVCSSINTTFQFRSHVIDGYTTLCVVLYRNNLPLELSDGVYSKLYDEVQWATSYTHGMCIVYDATSPSNIWPRAWLHNIVPYCTVGTQYNPLWLNGRLYVSLNPSGDYDRQYTECHDHLVHTLADMYTLGAVWCTDEWAGKWDLRRFDPDIAGVWVPNWADERITTDRAQFLLDAQTRPHIVLRIPDDNLLRHELARRTDCEFDLAASTVRVPSTGIQPIRDILDIVNGYNAHQKYTLYTWALAAQEQWTAYCAAVRSVYPTCECSVYRTDLGWRASVVVWDIVPDMDQVLTRTLTSN